MLMIRFVKIALSLVIFSWGSQIEAKPVVNQLNKAFYYVGRAEAPGRVGTSIDLGRFVLLFNEKPVINLLPDTQGGSGQERLTLFFPFAAVGSKECKKMVEDLNSSKSKYFTFRLEQLEKPTTGLQLSVVYDPKKVGYDQRRLETIKYDKGIEIRMFDREVLNAIKRAEAPRIASAKKKRSLLTADTGVMIQELYVMA